jgi:penicillin-binding protein 1A
MFVLTQAVQREINPYSTQYLSAPFVGPDNWHVHTFENTYSGRIPLTHATLLSDNTVFARLTLDLGPKPIAALAQQMGIQTKLKPVPSIVLGVNAVTPLELANAYATLADGGVAHDPSILSKVVFPGGQSEQASKSKGTRVVDAKVAGVVTRILEANVQSGTGTAAALSGRPAAGKTGTTDSFADAWFAGFVPQLTTVTWVGYPTREKPMQGVHGIAGVTGGTLPAQIWHTYMTDALQGQPVERLQAEAFAPQTQETQGDHDAAEDDDRSDDNLEDDDDDSGPDDAARHDHRAGDHHDSSADDHGTDDHHRSDDDGYDDNERPSLIHRGARMPGLRTVNAAAAKRPSSFRASSTTTRLRRRGWR